MYERPDVPKDNPNRNKIAVVVLVAIALGIFILGSTLWRLANVHSALGSKDVSRAVASATVSDESAQQLAEASGLTLTGDDVECAILGLLGSREPCRRHDARRMVGVSRCGGPGLLCAQAQRHKAHGRHREKRP